MLIRFRDQYDSEERSLKIAQLLPKQTLISEILEPLIEKRSFNALAECVRRELEIYRQYPKKPMPLPFKEEVKTFDPRNNETCFQGKAFKSNQSEAQDAELHAYRKAIGTVPHFMWGDCTLLEIWGGDHFAEHRKMVTAAFAYGMGQRQTCPKIKFYVNPLFKNQKSGDFRLSAKQREEKEYMDELMARAIVFGVKSPKEAIRSRRRGRAVR